MWLQMLEWKARGRGIKRIAKRSMSWESPQPGRGRTRTDHGVKHKVSSKWSPNTRR